MSIFDHALDQLRILFNIIAHQEESRRGVVGFQCVQNLLRAAVFVSCVEGQIDDLFRCVAQIGGIVFQQPVIAGVADGRLALRGEAQAPGAGGKRLILLTEAAEKDYTDQKQKQQYDQQPPQFMIHSTHLGQAYASPGAGMSAPQSGRQFFFLPFVTIFRRRHNME